TIVVPVGKAVLDRHVLALAIAALFQPLAEEGHYAGILGLARLASEPSDYRHRGLLRARRERPRGCRAAECSQQFPASDGDWHPPLPREVRKGNDPTSRAYSLAVQGGQDAGYFELSLRLPLHYSRRQLLANAAIAASGVGS